MKDSRLREPGCSNLRHPLPCHVVLLAAPSKRAPPEVRDVIAEGSECPGICGHRVVGEVSRDHTPQPPALGRYGIAHAGTQLRFDFLKCCSHTVAPSLTLKLEGSTPGLATDEDKAQESKGFRLAHTKPLSSRRRKAAKLQQPGLAPVKLKRKLLEPLSHRVPESPRISFVLKADHDVIGVAHGDDIAGGFTSLPLRGPEVEEVVKVDVCQQR